MPLPLKPSETLRGRYQINRIIGQGGMGCIYLADDLRLSGRQCALKEVEHDRSMSPDLLREAREQFLREATVLARLDHPNLPKVSDFFSIGNRDYLVMDYVPGKDLRTIMLEAKHAGKFLEESEVLNWANQLSSALEYLHNQVPPILHRDIKPGNLKLTPSGILKLVDFGLVKVLAQGEVTITILQGQGTAIYTPLEQYGGDTGHTDARTDIYAFSATLYHLLTNQPPPVARERFLSPESLVPPRQINPAVNPRIERAILMGMNLHPNERPESIEMFKQYLFGNEDFSVAHPLAHPFTLRDILRPSIENVLVWISASLILISLLVTVLL
jgi:eukaryotic-like serine/threonine-protein kinase